MTNAATDGPYALYDFEPTNAPKLLITLATGHQRYALACDLCGQEPQGDGTTLLRFDNGTTCIVDRDGLKSVAEQLIEISRKQQEQEN
jgi:hypothetical protein